MKQTVRNFYTVLPLLLVLAVFAITSTLGAVFQLLCVVGVPVALWATNRLHLMTDPAVAARSHEVSVPIVLTVMAVLLAFYYGSTVAHPGMESAASMTILRGSAIGMTVFAVLAMRKHVAPGSWSIFNGPAHCFRPAR